MLKIIKLERLQTSSLDKICFSYGFIQANKKESFKQDLPDLQVRGYNEQKDSHIHIDTQSSMMSIILGKVVMFKVTPNCWHRHYPFEIKRKKLQLNNITSTDVVKKKNCENMHNLLLLNNSFIN